MGNIGDTYKALLIDVERNPETGTKDTFLVGVFTSDGMVESAKYVATHHYREQRVTFKTIRVALDGMLFLPRSPWT